MKILGIDPGMAIVGYGLVEYDGEDCTLLHSGSIQTDKNKHELYGGFEKKERKIVKCLGGILRVADGLDRAHLSLIKKIKINYDEDNNIVEILLTPNTPEFRPDITSAIRKRDLFEIGFKCQSVIKFDDNCL